MVIFHSYVSLPEGIIYKWAIASIAIIFFKPEGMDGDNGMN
jgi:type I restriction-modification system DNA methylase subunit